MMLNLLPYFKVHDMKTLLKCADKVSFLLDISFRMEKNKQTNKQTQKTNTKYKQAIKNNQQQTNK